MSSTLIVSLMGVLALAVLHMAAGHLHRGAAVRPLWLTVASGMAVAYVFVHLLPELARSQTEWVEARQDRVLDWLDSQIYLAALSGVILSLALDRASRTRRGSGFWLQLTSYAIYNALIGGFALRITGVVPMILAVLAIGAHFVLNDHHLYARYREAYERTGRWVLAASIVIGWLVAAVWTEPVVVVAAVLGLVSGGIVANVLKEELPETNTGRFSPWVAGALSYAVLLLALKYSQY